MPFVDASANASAAAWKEVSGLGEDGGGADLDTSRMTRSWVVVRPASRARGS